MNGPCRRAVPALAVAALLTVGACAGSGTGTSGPGGAANGSDVTAATARLRAAPAETDTGCGADPTLSLRPLGPLPGPEELPAGSTMREIRDRGYLTAGIDQSTYPFGYVDPVTNRLRGFDIDLLREVAKAIFGSDDPKHIKFRVLANADRDDAVKRGDVDIVAETMTINCERRALVDFSTTYFTAGQRILIEKDGVNERADFSRGLGGLPAGMRVCAVPGSTSLQRIKDQAPHVTAVAGETWSDCLVRLQQGEADAVSTDDTILAGLKAQDPLFTEVVGQRITEEPYGMAISLTRPDFVRFVNALLEEMRTDGRWKALYREYIGTSLSPSVPEPPPARYRDRP